MTARVLVVDDVSANVRLLEARLTAEYFDVITASSGPQALDVCGRGQCDVVLLDVMMPGMDGLEVCRRLKANPATATIPVIMVTALDSPSDRVAGLEAGADDFLTKPVSDLALITRVRSLARVKTLTDELGARAATSAQMGLEPDVSAAAGRGGRVLIVDDRPASYERVVDALQREHEVMLEREPQEAVFRAAEGGFDLVIVSLDLADFDGLRLCSQLRSLERTRSIPLLVLVTPGDEARLMRGLDLGVNDYLLRPVDRNELLARVRTQIRRKRYADRLRDGMQLTLEMAITDGLTGLHNRRYFDRHLAGLVEQAVQRNRPLSLMLLDLDHFKAVNDTYGHGAGDAVLIEFARRIRGALRGIDLAGRYGGEEFIVAMPDTDGRLACTIGERLREKVSGEPFPVVPGIDPLAVTASIGVSSLEGPGDTPAALVRRADEALYRAKRDGRNRVAAAA